MTVGKRGVTRTVGIPGTGIYNTKTTSFKKTSRGNEPNQPKIDLSTDGSGNTPSQTPPNSGNNKKGCGCAAVGIIVLIVIISIIASQCSGGSKTAKKTSSAPVAAAVSSEVSSAPASSAESSAPTPSAASIASVSSAAESSAPASSAAPAVAVTSTAPKASGSLTVTKAPGTVAPGSKASVTIKGTPGQSYSIAVHYSSGISKADGLEDKTADSNGNVTWQWEVGPKTKAGTFNVNISGGGQTAATQITVQ